MIEKLQSWQRVLNSDLLSLWKYYYIFKLKPLKTTSMLLCPDYITILPLVNGKATSELMLSITFCKSTIAEIVAQLYL